QLAFLLPESADFPFRDYTADLARIIHGTTNSSGTSTPAFHE
ncbi:MAG: hypothetical protein ACI8UP_005341, partial [Porticoccaceae bacterium]